MTTDLRRPVLAVGAVLWNARREVLLVRRSRPPREWEWSIPGGKVEWGETLEDALKREILEETGLSAEVGALIEVVDSLIRDEAGALAHHHVLADFTARATGGTLKAGDDAAEVRWVRLAELSQYEMWSETHRIIVQSATLQK